MKSFSAPLLTIVSCALLSSALPAQKRNIFATDTANDMEDVISNGAPCKDVAVIFARGTFDSGNMGVWVGPQFQAALQSQINSLAFQGVDASAYPATLQSYLAEGGSNSGAQSLADTVTSYVGACPNSNVVISGWSQGALVAHKGLALLSSDIQAKVVGLATWGDPNQLFDNSAVPAGIAFNTQCIGGTTLDPLCSVLSQDFVFPTTLDDITGPFKQLPGLASGAAETTAAATLVLEFPGQLLASSSAFFAALTDKSKLQRLLLTPEHFTYGNNGLTTDSANFVAGLPAVAGK
ncbi:carbohydrate esterase family 5 protein [Mycena metata]|uniref:cutinase n=1 Tax=Mycena metata TaxID=1033252 RepID=A0AAD7MQ09_9AGAR|nr:carbohydrate esterase family 5 protein [Mycena metata]